MILLTGASGYLGRHIHEKIYDRGLHAVITTRSDCDMLNRGEVSALFRRIKPTRIIHCAAWVPKESAEYYSPLTHDGLLMLENLSEYSMVPIVFASSHVATEPQTPYARSKALAEEVLRATNRGDVILRLPGLFGLPRRSGVIYGACKNGFIPESFGPYPAMHVQDAAEYLVRAATMPSDGKPEPYSVVYGDPRLEATYGSLNVTFAQRVEQFREELQREQVNA